MNEKTILKAEGVGELLGGVTALLGFTPSQSLAIAPFVGAQTHRVIRVDLPTEENRAGVVAHLMGMLCRVPDVTGFAAVVYTDSPATEQEALASDLMLAGSFVGLDVHAVLYAAPEGWGEFFEGAAQPSVSLPPLPLPGLVKDGDQESGAALPPVEAALLDALSTAEPAIPVVQDAIALFEEATGWDADALDPVKAVTLAAMLSKPLLRDTALVQWATDEQTGREALAAQIAFRDAGEQVPEHIGAIFIGRGTRPDAARLQNTLAVCRMLAAHVPHEQKAALLTVAGWLAWAMGNSTHAALYVSQAMQADPALTMAQLLAEIINRSMLPDWAFQD